MYQLAKNLVLRAAILLFAFSFTDLMAAQSPTPPDQQTAAQQPTSAQPQSAPPPAPSTQQAPSPQPHLPNAPAPASSSPSQEPSLSDLGFTPQQTQSDPKLQAELNKRTEMLKIHQRLGLITLAPMVATLITGPMAKAKGKNGQTITEPSNANLDFHAALGGTTAALYFSTAYFAMFAPKVPGNPKHGAIKLHEVLAFVHGPGMILTPILGYDAYKQENAGEKVHGIASLHGTVAIATIGAYGASIIAVSWPIHLKFWEKK
jgi:cation transport ATPase